MKLISALLLSVPLLISTPGPRIGFQTYETSNNHIYIVNPDGSGLEELLSDHDTIQPDFSHDGRYLAFVNTVDSMYMYIFLYDTETERIRRITLNNGTQEYSPDISPDTAWIVYISDLVDPEIYKVNLKTYRTVQLTDSEADKRNPEWSPDSKSIAYESDEDGNYEIWIMDSDGKNIRQLTFTEDCMNSSPAYSPDGDYIYFYSDMNDDFEIYRIHPDGTGLEQVTDNDVLDKHPAVSPDGKFLAYASKINGAYNIYVMDLESGETRQVTNMSSDKMVSRPGWTK